MTGQFDLGRKHVECVNKIKDITSKINEIRSEENKNPKDIIKKYLAESIGSLPQESSVYGDYLGMTLAVEEIAKIDPLSAYILIDQILFKEIMKKYSAHKAEDVVAKGQTVSLLCLETGFAGLENIKTKAVRTSEGWTITGDKAISSEQIYSNKFVVFAKDEENKIRLFAIPEENIKVEETEQKFSSSKVILNHINLNHSVSEAQNIAVINDDYEEIFAKARTLIAAASVGIAHSALIKSIEVAKGTKSATGENISNSQNIQFTLADMFSEIEASRMLTYYSADSLDKNVPNIKIASMAKVKASEASSNIMIKALSIFGNIGFINNIDFASLIQRSIDGQVKEGTNRVQKSQIYGYMLAKK